MIREYLGTAGRALVGLCLLAIAGCAPGISMPTEIPVGGVREAITRETLAAARQGMPGGLLEPGWLPDGFVLVSADFIKGGNRIQSVDLAYDGRGHYLHVWQTNMSPAEMGESDPVPKGEPMDDLDWNVNPLPVAQAGREGVVEYSRRLDDGRTVSVDSDLDGDTMRRVLESLLVRTGDVGS